MRTCAVRGLGFLALLAALCAATAASARDFDQRMSAEPGGRLVVKLDAGRVAIEGHDEAEVRVEASTSGLGDGMRFTLERSGDQIELRGRRQGVIGWLASPRVRVRIRVPETFSLDVDTSRGEIDVEGIVGALVARTGGGEVSASEITGPVDLRTSGGRIAASEIAGDLVVRTSGGAVRIDEVEGRIEAETSGGPVEAHDVSGPVRVRSSGGPISVRFTRAPAGEIRTSGGGIELSFPEDAGLRIDAETRGGGVELDPALSLRGDRSRDRVRGELNGGGALVHIRTSGGRIRIRER